MLGEMINWKLRSTKFSILMKKNERATLLVVIATGISSIVVQLIIIREFLAQFHGNEFIISLILFNWLILGGIGTLVAHLITPRYWGPSSSRLCWLSFILAALSVILIYIIRELRDFFFVHGSSVGFYPTLAYIFLTIAPYCLLIGFILPYSLFVLRAETPDYSGTRIYITDNIGDITGGALFSFALVFLVTPLKAILISNLPLVATSFLLFSLTGKQRKYLKMMIGAAIILFVFAAGIFFEPFSLEPSEGKLVHYRESRYGRIAVHQDNGQYTLFTDGVPVFSNQNQSIAEETIHYPLAQLDNPQSVLLISGEGGIMKELKKHGLKTVDYVELDPRITAVLFKFGLIENIEGLNVINQDGRAFLADSDNIYDAIILNLPEPDTFQINRFFTDQFFSLVKRHLAPDGVLSFSMEGYDNYLAEPQRQKLSSLYNTVKNNFKHILLMPGLKIFFLCRDISIKTDIPARLAEKDIMTRYIRGYYDGNLTKERISDLNDLMDPNTPKNSDDSPLLMRLMFSQWFAKFSTSPVGFIAVLAGLTIIYLFRIKREEFVLFSTGAMTMGSEILIIFAFQIFYGYIYFQIGLIITIFLAGLLPGALLGDRLREGGKQILVLTDGLLITLIGILILALKIGGDRLPSFFFLVFGFMISLACGFQFPVALHLGGGGNSAVTRSFSADLIGAACGILITSLILLPYLGLIWAATGLIFLKLASLIVIGTYHEKYKQKGFSLL
jgi:spermidine synthase